MSADTITVVVADDPGEALAPLTAERTKAALPFGGEYRVVDFVLSNCLHSGLRRVLVLTGARSYSLQRHLRDGWSVFNPELGEFITPVPPRHGDDEAWHGGAADRLFESLYLLERSGAKHALVLNGGHVYRMDYSALLAAHRELASDVTVGCVEVDAARAAEHASVSIDENAPGGPRVVRLAHAPAAREPGARTSVAMGVYAFDLDVLLTLLATDRAADGSGHDFDVDVIGPRVRELRVGAYRFGGKSGRVSRDRYWGDLSDLDAYFRANLSLLEAVPPLDLYQDSWPIWSRTERNPPARTVESFQGNEGLFVNSIVSNGTVVRGGAVSRAVLFPRVRVEDSATVERSVLFHGVHVGEGSTVRNCIVDKNVQIPPGTRIGVDIEEDAARFRLTPEGVAVIPKGYESTPTHAPIGPITA